MSSSTAKTVAPATSPSSRASVFSISPSRASVSATWMAATKSSSSESSTKEAGSVALTAKGVFGGTYASEDSSAPPELSSPLQPAARIAQTRIAAVEARSRIRRKSRERSLTLEVGQDLLRVSAEEVVAGAADLVDVELVDAGVGELLHGLDVALEMRAARHRVGQRLLGHQLGRLFEVLGGGQDLRQLSRKALVGPEPADGHL